MKASFLFGISILFISGCASTSNSSVVQMEQGRIIQYNIPSELVPNNAASDYFLKAYRNALADSSAYHSVSYGGGLREGVELSHTDNKVTIAYISAGAAGKTKNNYSADFILQTVHSADSYTLTVQCPSSLFHDYEGLSALPFAPFIAPEKVQQDVNAICVKTNITFSQKVGGEIDTDYNDSSVFANFDRKLKKLYNPRPDQVREYDLEKSTWFYFDDQGAQREVAVSVFPYRNGSKVVYKTSRIVTCLPNGVCTNYDPTFAQRMRDLLTSIAND